MNKQHCIFSWQWVGALAISLGTIGTFDSLPAEARSNPLGDSVEAIQTDLSSSTSLENADSLLIARHHQHHRQQRRHGGIRHHSFRRNKGFGFSFGRQHRPRFNRHHRIHRSRIHRRGTTRNYFGSPSGRYGNSRYRKRF